MIDALLATRLRWQHPALALGLCTALLVGCASAPSPTFCESSAFLIDRNFEGGAFADCTFRSATEVDIVIAPEDLPPINPSPWYAFRVSPKTAAELTVTVRFTEAGFRYWPQLRDGDGAWRRADQADVKVLADGLAFELTVRSTTHAILVAAQELITTQHYADWLHELIDTEGVSARVIGRSVQGRPIHAIETSPSQEVVFLIGRQHPPEVTGALAMQAFLAILVGDSPLAQRFRARYSVVAIPLLNPDGVALGHWRHNADGVDLNRDWGSFSQPETAAVAALVEQLLLAGRQPAMMLDFHSTRDNLFYTQLPEETLWPVDFATVWFERVRARDSEIDFQHAPRSGSDQANTKNYFFDRFGIPAMTYELGDDEQRDGIAGSAAVFAEEFMGLLLEYPAAAQP